MTVSSKLFRIAPLLQETVLSRKPDSTIALPHRVGGTSAHVYQHRRMLETKFYDTIANLFARSPLLDLKNYFSQI